MTAGNYMQAYNTGPQIALEQVPTGGGASAVIPMDTAGQVAIQITYNV